MKTKILVSIFLIASVCLADSLGQAWTHKKSGTTFLAPKAWVWHDSPDHSTINKICYPPTAKSYLPICIIRIKEEDPARKITFPMVVTHAKYKLSKFVDGFDFEDGNLIAKEGKILIDEKIELPFDNDGAYNVRLDGKIKERGNPVDINAIVFMKGNTWYMLFFGCKNGEFDIYKNDFNTMVENISFKK